MNKFAVIRIKFNSRKRAFFVIQQSDLSSQVPVYTLDLQLEGYDSFPEAEQAAVKFSAAPSAASQGR